MSKQTSTATADTTEAKRPVGRPATFPGIETRMHAANLPVDTIAGLKALAKQRGVPLNSIMHTILSQAINRAAKDRARRAPKTA
jgi:hypothetical protein